MKKETKKELDVTNKENAFDLPAPQRLRER